MEFVTSRLILREFTAEDLPAFLALEADPRLAEFRGADEVGPDFARSLIERFLLWAAESPRLNYQLAIAQRDNSSQSIGTCGIRLQGCEAGMGEFGLQIAPEHWGCGFATEAARAILGFAFRDLGLQRVHGDTVTENTRVQRLVVRLGFKKVETRPGPAWMQARGWSQTVWSLTAVDESSGTNVESLRLIE